MRRDGVIAGAGSQRGVALPLALLLFLVCALLASVVLAASTTVSGRHARLAQLDQGYYSVMSATDLIKSQLEDAVVFVRAEREAYVSTVFAYGGAGSAGAGETGTPTTKLYIASVPREDADAGVEPGESDYRPLGSATGDAALLGSAALSDCTLAQQTALHALFGSNPASLTAGAAWGCLGYYLGYPESSLPSSTIEKRYVLFHDVTAGLPEGVRSEDVESALAVSVKQSIDPGVSTTFSLESGADGDSGRFSAALELGADMSVEESTGESDSELTGSGSSLEETAKVTTVRVAAVSWSATGLSKSGEDL